MEITVQGILDLIVVVRNLLIVVVAMEVVPAVAVDMVAEEDFKQL